MGRWKGFLNCNAGDRRPETGNRKSEIGNREREKNMVARLQSLPAHIFFETANTGDLFQFQ